MDLFILGAGMGVVGGLLPNPLQLIALTQAALGRWGRAMFVVLVPPLVVDATFLVATLLFYQFIPFGIAHYVAYAGGVLVTSFASYGLWNLRQNRQQKAAEARSYTVAGVTVATLAEVTAPGTWIYWATIAGPILAEGRARGYGQVVPFFIGSWAGYNGAAVLSTCLMVWVAGLHRSFTKYLFLIANVLLFLIGISYLIRAYLGRSF
ncbi:MAG TPA: hypothetical protein VGZ29_03140 [Terriglobia bacterium]|nr:hypothetical protein [Terriglobia bacterium]